MHIGRSSILVVAATATLVLTSVGAITAQPMPPSHDPWYTAPPSFELTQPGAVLRVRLAPGNLTSLVPNAWQAYNVLFRTTDSLYHPSWAVTTLFVPKSALNSSSTALLSYQIPYNTPAVDGSPSQLLYTTPTTDLTVTDIGTALGYGWHVSVPDFEGPLAAFGAGVQEGHAVIDSIRAVRSVGLGLADNARVALWGYSGGSIASEFAAELAIQYAPELSIAGVALGGLVANLTQGILQVSKTQFAALVPLGLLGITAQYPAAREYLLSQLNPSGPHNATGFLAALNLSVVKAFPVYAFQDTWSYLKSGKAVLQSPLLQPILQSQALLGYHGTPKAPLYIYKAIADEITPVASTDALVERYCGVGVSVQYLRNSVGGHLAEETNGDAYALEWLRQVFDGKEQGSGCVVKDVVWNTTASPI